eukprot:Polyplicarium_translucidae@DN2882_c0_g1_i2.p1
MRHSVDLIVAVDEEWGIGRDGQLPWGSLKEDLRHFSRTTRRAPSGRRNAVVMGRRTFGSLGSRPLPGRLNIVVSSKLESTADYVVAPSLSAAIALAGGHDDVDKIFVCGGASLYDEAFSSEVVDRVHLTRIAGKFSSDVRVKPFPLGTFRCSWCSKTIVEGGIPFVFSTYEKIDDDEEEEKDERTKENHFAVEIGSVRPPPLTAGGEHDELQYLRLVEEIMRTGVLQDDRTGVGTRALFGAQMRFDLRSCFPLLTTKRVFWRGVVEELMWFIGGNTNANILTEKGIKIWEGNGSREFLDGRGLSHREVGDLGPVYGFQWRHFGAEYRDMHADYGGQGVDQLAQCIDKIKTDPCNRRIIFSAWNPAAEPQMALPPCHMFCQFFVANGELSSLMFQRSADMGLGVPFNIASYALLTLMVAHVCDLRPGDFVHSIGNAHVYSNHFEALREQLSRTPRPFPIVTVNRKVDNIDDFTSADITLSNYFPCGSIKMQMAV